jgi:hypothetical protein
MIKLPKLRNSFEYENNFYLTCNSDRISKILIQYELFLKTQKISGDIIECGVYKGLSLIRLAIFRNLLQKQSKKIIGFDTFGKFPSAKFSKDVKQRKKFLEKSGEQSISTTQLSKILKQKKISKNVELVKGDVAKSIPNYLSKNPNLKISLLNLDVDLYEPSKIILENLFPKISKGGILILDDYNIFPGETKAVNEYFKNKNYTIKQFEFRKTPSYVIKK